MSISMENNLVRGKRVQFNAFPPYIELRTNVRGDQQNLTLAQWQTSKPINEIH